MYKENINDAFTLPIHYHYNTNIGDNINNDLELQITQDPSNTPIYKETKRNYLINSIQLFKLFSKNWVLK